MSFRPFNLTADSSCRERVPTAFQMAALIGLGASTNDASRSASLVRDGHCPKLLPLSCGDAHVAKANAGTSIKAVLIITTLLAFASGICEVLA